MLVVGLIALVSQFFWYFFGVPYRTELQWNNNVRACGILVASLSWVCRYRLTTLPPGAAATDRILASLSFATAAFALLLLTLIIWSFLDCMFRSLVLSKLRQTREEAAIALSKLGGYMSKEELKAGSPGRSAPPFIARIGLPPIMVALPSFGAINDVINPIVSSNSNANAVTHSVRLSRVVIPAQQIRPKKARPYSVLSTQLSQPVYTSVYDCD
jgi:hypothetical protein